MMLQDGAHTTGHSRPCAGCRITSKCDFNHILGCQEDGLGERQSERMLRRYSDAAWERMDENDTKRTLRYLRENRWILLLEAALDDMSGLAYEDLARRGAVAQGATPDSSPKPSQPSSQTPQEALKPLMLKYRS